MNSNIESVKQFLIDEIRNLERCMGMMQKQAHEDAREAILFCQTILDNASQPFNATDNIQPPDWAFRCPFCRIKHETLEETWKCCR